MTDPDRNGQMPNRNTVSLWILVALMALIVVGGLVYGLSYPTIYSGNPQTVGAALPHHYPTRPM